MNASGRRPLNTLVLGLGNLLLRDEGVGVHVARALIEQGLPAGVSVLDIGTAILDALPAMEKADRIIVIDAVMADGGTPGAIYRMSLDAFEENRCIASMHGFDISRTLALAGRSESPEVVVIGVEPAQIDWSLELSTEVSQALPEVVKLIYAEIERS